MHKNANSMHIYTRPGKLMQMAWSAGCCGVSIVYWSMDKFRRTASREECELDGGVSLGLRGGAGVVESCGANLMDPRFDHDSCGVGFVASIQAVRSHEILEQSLTALARLAHRGAIAADGKSSDGVGIMTAIPVKFFLETAQISLPDGLALGVGMLFLGAEDVQSVPTLEECLAAHDLSVLKWREVPIRPELLGEIALGTMPLIRQVFVCAADGADLTTVERRLYLARKQFERASEANPEEIAGYLCSLSARTIVYKAMCSGELLRDFYPDLKSADYVTPFAIFHQRYATNTSPTWHRAQPGRNLAHNGEINTVWGNRARMAARDSSLPVECKPILTSGGTDSTSLDEAIELLSRNGRTLAESVRMLLPPAASDRFSSFLKYHTDCAEPWDGPAAIAFSDGRAVGAALDRNGLRPCRYSITSSGLVVAGSEVGLVDLDPNEVIESGRLGPGQMIGIDLEEKKLYKDDDLLREFDTRETYEILAADTPLVAAPINAALPSAELLAMQRGFGYTREDVRMILQPMAMEGKDAVWSMGDDAPLAFMAHSPRPLYAFFRQRFAQVTNPAIDPLREACVVSLHTRLGPWPHMLDKHAPLPGITLASPFLSLGQVEALRRGAFDHSDDLRMAELRCHMNATQTLAAALDEVGQRAIELVRDGARMLLLTDRGASGEAIAMPMAMATGVVHQALVDAGLRTLAGLAVEAGDCRDVHHAAVLIGFGAGALCPWLALETARGIAPARATDPAIDPEVSEQKMLKAFDAGLAKIMSKMGISVVDSYRGAHLFDILGLHKSVTDRCFPGTPAVLSGIGFAEIERQLRSAWTAPAEVTVAVDLPDFGWVRFRKADTAEPHGWQPATVKQLQAVVGSARGVAPPSDASASAEAFHIFSKDVGSQKPAVLRDLLEIRPAGPELALRDVQAPSDLVKKFCASAMSLGSLSPEAHQTITQAMNMLGARSNTGEGGEDPSVYRPVAVSMPSVAAGSGAASVGSVAVAERVTVAPAVHTMLNNKIKQIASGRFGVTAEYLAHAEEIEIKVAQGAKPGEGGQLPGHKVSGLIARLRHAQPGVSLISPPPHHDIYSIEDLAQLIYDLKRVNPRAAIGVKLVSGLGVGTVAAGVAKAYADYIVIAGNNGGTGAAALSSIKYAGNPWELGLAEAQQVLVANGMRGRVRLRTDGGLTTARDVLIAAMLGADEFAFGTAVLVVLGCDMARQCHLNTCPTGIATQKPELRAKFRGKPEHVVTFFKELAADVQRMLGFYGLASLEEAVGRVDLLEQARFDGNLDLSSMLARVGTGVKSWQGGRNDRPAVPLAIDEAWVGPAVAAAVAGVPYEVTSEIANKDRAIGARLSGELAVLRAKGELQHTPEITFNLSGTAGQSFGAFTGEGIHLVLDGQANDFVGKGLSGGELVLRACGLAAHDSGHHVILGNVALYGATSGRLFAAGRAGERFAVRNSGAVAVVEGVGDHGCEYMTGGVVVVLGGAGINFGAGMTGGLAWVYDEDGSFVGKHRFHGEFLTAEAFGECDLEAQQGLRALLEEHVARSLSSKGKAVLAGWPGLAGAFVRLTPKPQV